MSNRSLVQPGRDARKIHADNSIALFDPAVQQVRLDEIRGPPVVVDERHVRRAAAQRFDADRTGAGVAVEDARAGDQTGRAR